MNVKDVKSIKTILFIKTTIKKTFRLVSL